jgi:Core-2/I-Branching enzyme
MSEALAASLACVVLAHTDPMHVRRLVSALDPFPVFLHCDARTAQPVFDEMTDRLPDRVTVLPRRRTPWGSWGNVAAELDGYRAALRGSDATHVAVLSGSDYPLASAEEITGYLDARRGRSIGWCFPLPKEGWAGGGYWRLRYRFAAWRKHMLALPVPRPLPRGVVLAGGSQWKILARPHVEALLRAVDQRPDLVRRWRRTWIPDETFVYSILHTPDLVPGWRDEHVNSDPWVIHWSDGERRSPAWLTSADLDVLGIRRSGDSGRGPALFARKFATSVDTEVLDRIDRSFRGSPSLGPVGS